MSKRILELDGLRAFAVIGVVITHMSVHSQIIPSFNPAITKILDMFGSIGVSIFFLISGFIITSLLLREKDKTGDVSLTNFYIRRFFRIIPPFAVYMLTLAILFNAGLIKLNLSDFFSSAVFLGNLTAVDASGFFVGHTWSLSTEEQYYLLFPPLLCIVFKFRRKPLALFLCLLLLIGYPSRWIGTQMQVFSEEWMKLSVLKSFRFIIIGVLVALFYPKLKDKLTNVSRIFPMTLGLLVIGFQFLPFGVIAFALDGLTPLLYAAFVVWFIQNPDKCATLRLGAVQWLGMTSYSIYLWQQLFTGRSELYAGWNPTSFPVAVIGILTCAAISYYLIEKPSIILGRRANDCFSKNRISNFH